MTFGRMVRRILLPLLVLTALGFGAWTALTAYRLEQDVSGAVTDAALLQDAMQVGDNASAAAALEDLRGRLEVADSRTHGVVWAVATRLPAIGDDATGVRVVTEVLTDLAASGLEPLVDRAADLDALSPKDGTIPLDQLAVLAPAVQDASRSFESARERLKAEDSTGYIDPLAAKYDDLTERVTKAAELLGTADTALSVMPAMLGVDGPRSYLLVFENNAEVRSTGGLPGAAALIRAENGRLQIQEQVTGNSFGEAPEPILPLTKAEVEIYNRQLGTYFLDANFTPDFPRAAELFAAHWTKRFGGTLDGVLSVDPIAMSYALAVTGPVQVGDVTLTADNAVDELLHRSYLRELDPSILDDFFAAAARAIFDTVVGGGTDPRGMLRALDRGVTEHRIRVSSTHPEEAAVLEQSLVGQGIFGDSGETPQVGVYLNDSTAAKMSYFLRTAVVVTSTSCEAGVQTLEGSATVSSVAPADAASLPDYVTGGGAYGIPPGHQIVGVRLYAPQGGEFTGRVVIGGREFKDPFIVDHEGRPELTTYVDLGPGESKEVTWQMHTGAGQTGDVDVQVTPGVVPENASFVAASSC